MGREGRCRRKYGKALVSSRGLEYRLLCTLGECFRVRFRYVIFMGQIRVAGESLRGRVELGIR